MFKQTIIAMALMGASTVHAVDMIDDVDLCDKAVAYSVKYLPEEDDAKLHEARWKIIEGDRTDDAQKLISLVVFEIGQRIGYSYDSEIHGDGKEWVEEQIEAMAHGCEIGILEIRGNTESYGEFESANPDEAW